MSHRERRHFSGEEKVKLRRMHEVEGTVVSNLCEAHQISLSLSCQWQRTFFENGSKAFEGQGKSFKSCLSENKVEVLEAKLLRHHEVLSELMEEHVRLRKELGEI